MQEYQEPIQTVKDDRETVLRVRWLARTHDYQAVYVGGADEYIWIVDDGATTHAIKETRVRNALRERAPDYELLPLEKSQFTPP